MKNRRKFLFLSFPIIFLFSFQLNAKTSANVGYESEYIFRGVTQKESSASAGLDFQTNGFCIGTWAAQVVDALEVDGFLGYLGSDKSGDFTSNIAFTGYYYTDDFDDTYEELNLGFCFSSFCFDSAFGDYSNFDGPALDYTFLAASYAFDNGFYLKYGEYSQDYEGGYIELGYGFSIAQMNGAIKYISSNSSLVIPSGDKFLVFGVTKLFRLNKSIDI